MMKIIDACNTSQSKPLQNYDVCIIGAGAAGLYLSKSLAKSGVRVCILEAGNEICTPGSNLGFTPEFVGHAYDGAIAGRAFGIGGTTSLWGGQLLPYTKYDIRENTKFTHIWPHIVEQVKTFSSNVYSTLDIKKEFDFNTFYASHLDNKFNLFNQSDFALLSSDWLPFQHRNLRFLIEKTKAKNLNIDIYINAVVSKWNVRKGHDLDSQVIGVIARTPEKKELEVLAKQFVIAAGAIESPRILLEIFSEKEAFSVLKRQAVGNYLSDHLSTSVAEISKADSQIICKLFGPKFKNGRMRTFRFIEKGIDSCLPNSFFHFIFKQQNSGFNLAKKVIQGLQGKKQLNIQATEIVSGVRGLSYLAYNRYVKKQLYIPESTAINLQLDIEQCPDFSNRVSLSNEKDIYGRFRSKICWKISPRDYENINKVTTNFIKKWPFKISKPEIVFPSDLREKLYDTYHPVGTCRMGSDDEAVVDTNMKAYGLMNVYVTTTGIFPTSGTANPTFSLLCLTDRLAQHLKNKI